MRLLARTRSALIDPQRDAWELRAVVSLPEVGRCNALTWLRGGTLLAGVGAQLALCPAVLSSPRSGGRLRGSLPQWHPAVLKQHLLSGNVCDSILQHLQGHSTLQAATRMDLTDLIASPASVPLSSSDTSAATVSAEDLFAPSSTAELEDLFAPSSGPSAADLDFFAPSEPVDLLAQIDALP